MSRLISPPESVRLASSRASSLAPRDSASAAAYDEIRVVGGERVAPTATALFDYLAVVKLDSVASLVAVGCPVADAVALCREQIQVLGAITAVVAAATGAADFRRGNHPPSGLSQPVSRRARKRAGHAERVSNVSSSSVGSGLSAPTSVSSGFSRCSAPAPRLEPGTDGDFPPGFCYLEAVVPDRAAGLALKLADRPTLAQLLVEPAESFRSHAHLRALGVVRYPGGVYHVTRGTQEADTNLLTLFRSLDLSLYPKGSLGESVRVYTACAYPCQASERVAGFGEDGPPGLPAAAPESRGHGEPGCGCCSVVNAFAAGKSEYRWQCVTAFVSDITSASVVRSGTRGALVFGSGPDLLGIWPLSGNITETSAGKLFVGRVRCMLCEGSYAVCKCSVSGLRVRVYAPGRPSFKTGARPCGHMVLSESSPALALRELVRSAARKAVAVLGLPERVPEVQQVAVDPRLQCETEWGALPAQAFQPFPVGGRLGAVRVRVVMGGFGDYDRAERLLKKLEMESDLADAGADCQIDWDCESGGWVFVDPSKLALVGERLMTARWVSGASYLGGPQWTYDGPSVGVDSFG